MFNRHVQQEAIPPGAEQKAEEKVQPKDAPQEKPSEQKTEIEQPDAKAESCFATRKKSTRSSKQHNAERQ